MPVRLRGGWVRRAAATSWLAWLVPIFAWAPLAYPGYFEFLNGFSPVFNLDDFLRRGAGLAWLPGFGQPASVLRGEGWLPYALAALPRGLGLPGYVAVKVTLAAAILAGALGTYGWARRTGLGDWPALLASAVYAFWPLGLATIYVRGALGEAVLLGLLPLVLWAASAALDAGRRALWPAAGLAVALAAALWTQTGLALWLAAMALAYVALGRAPGRRFALLGWLGGVALGLAGRAPAYLARAAGQASSGPSVDFFAHFVYPHQLLQPGWAVAPSVSGPYDALPLGLGIAACGLAVLGIVLAAETRGEGAGARGVAVAAAMAAAPVILSLSLAAPAWRAARFLAGTLTYPWQLLLVAGPWLAWLAGLGGRELALRAAWDGAAVGEDAAAGASSSFGSPTTAAGEQGAASEASAAPRDGRAQPAALFAGLMALALLGVYGNLNPPAVPGAVPDRPLAVFGGDRLALVSAAVEGTPGPGQPITVTVQWQALRPLDQDYTVFLHVVAPDGSPAGQVDTMPQRNQYPTGRWRVGEVVPDAYGVTLPAGAPAAGDYRLELGLYQYQTGERLRAGDDDKVTLPGPAAAPAAVAAGRPLAAGAGTRGRR